jgi:SAM-dependent methyltransferase
LEKGIMAAATGKEVIALELLSELAPPLKLGFAGDGSPDYSSFGHTGARFFRHLTTLGGLQPTDSVLEVGCAIGRMALHLIPYLRDQGRYEGFDINPIGVTWCLRKIAGKFPRFRFHLADV